VEALRVDDPVSGSSAEDEQIIGRAFGLDRLLGGHMAGGLIPRDQHAAAMPKLMTKVVEGIRLLTDVFEAARPGDLLQSADDTRLSEVRDELQVVERALLGVCAIMETALGKGEATLFVDIRRAAAKMGPSDHALMVLLWLALRSRLPHEQVEPWLHAARVSEPYLPALLAFLTQTGSHKGRQGQHERDK
jgi:hypothetical protein